MSQSQRFAKEFEAEAVRLVQTSGRTQREVAEDLGIGLSTLARWISRSRDRHIDEPRPGRQEDMAAELKRLCPGMRSFATSETSWSGPPLFPPARVVDDVPAH